MNKRIARKRLMQYLRRSCFILRDGEPHRVRDYWIMWLFEAEHLQPHRYS